MKIKNQNKYNNNNKNEAMKKKGFQNLKRMFVVSMLPKQNKNNGNTEKKSCRKKNEFETQSSLSVELFASRQKN